MERIWIAVGVVLSLVNIALFLLWMSLVKVDASIPGEESQYVLNALSVQVVILEAVLAAVGIGLATVGFFGYQSIKEAAVAKALSATTKQTQDFLNLVSKENGLETSGGKKYSESPDDNDNVTIEKEGGTV